MIVLAAAAALLVIALWLAIELYTWRGRRRPPGAGALRDYYNSTHGAEGDGAERLRDRRPW